MIRALWPLLVIIAIDAVCAWAIIERIVAHSMRNDITRGFEGAYLACGMLLVQGPLCALGMAVTKSKHRWLFRVYAGHLVVTALLCVTSNIDLGGCVRILAV